VSSVESQQTEVQAKQDLASRPVIGGWLLVLCLVLTVVYPATSFYAIFWRTIPKLIGSHTLASALLGVHSLLFTAVAVFSFWAGMGLWLIKPGAVTFAKRYLLGYLIAHVAYFVFWLILTRPTQMLSLAEMGWYHGVGPAPSTALWYF
jgi:hypothetical protein